MIWLASFPRSGNTFFRNVLFEVYGIPSSTYHLDPQRQLDEGFADYAVVKTHLLPENLPVAYQDVPAVYLVRDGRDALLSIAHHRKDIVRPGSDLYTNLLEAILAQGGSFFGGWSKNVSQWTSKAAIVIRFEDLIADPIREVEKLRAIMPLPAPNREKLPDFKALKFGQPKYGGGGKKTFNSARNQKHFRSGKVGGWKAEMAPELIELLMNINGPLLKKWGYAPDWLPFSGTPAKIMIECSKLYGQDNDGVKRYLTELVNALSIILPHYPRYQVALYDRKSVQPLVQTAKVPEASQLPEQQFRKVSSKEAILSDRRTMGYEKLMLLAKDAVKWTIPASWYGRVSDYYRKGPFRSYLHKMKLFARRWKFQENEQAVFSKIAAADLIHLPLPQHFQELPPSPPPVICTIHDLTHILLPEFHDQQNVDLASLGMKALAENNAYLLAVSKATLKDIKTHLPLSEIGFGMVYEGVNHTLFHPRNRQEDISWLRDRYHIPKRPFFMCLSTIEPRKNLGNTIRAFLRFKKTFPELEEVLLICGKSGWKTDEVFKDIDLDHPDLIFTGFVDDVHLPQLYAHARALCYISHYEGFGLPMLEAMACATPVIYGDKSSMQELAQEGGLSATATDIQQIMEKMHLLASDQERWQSMSLAAWQEAQSFSWLKTAVQTLSVYRSVMEKSPA